jgi:hypothetical protein
MDDWPFYLITSLIKTLVVLVNCQTVIKFHTEAYLENLNVIHATGMTVALFKYLISHSTQSSAG